MEILRLYEFEGVLWVDYICPLHGEGSVKYDTASKKRSRGCITCSKEVSARARKEALREKMQNGLALIEANYKQVHGLSVKISRSLKGIYYLECLKCKEDIFTKEINSPFVFSIRKNALNSLSIPCRCSRSPQLTSDERNLKALLKLKDLGKPFKSYQFLGDKISYHCECGKVNLKKSSDIIKGMFGCSGCSVGGYSTSKDGYTYLLTLEVSGLLLHKIGITNNITKRIMFLTANSNGNIKMLDSKVYKFSDGNIPPIIEKKFLSKGDPFLGKDLMRQGFSETREFSLNREYEFENICKNSGGDVSLLITTN